MLSFAVGSYHTSYISRYEPNTFDYMGLFSPALNNKPEQYPLAPAFQNLGKKLKRQMDNNYKLYWIAVCKNDFRILFNAIKEYRCAQKNLSAAEPLYGVPLKLSKN